LDRAGSFADCGQYQSSEPAANINRANDPLSFAAPADLAPLPY
jgi:hypothetical protein